MRLGREGFQRFGARQHSRWRRRNRYGPCHQRLARLLFERLESRHLLAFGLTTSTNSYTVDTGANVVFAINRTTALGGSVGDLQSMKYNGTELEASFSATSRYSHYESGLSSTTAVSATVDPQGNWIKITCDDTNGTGVIQYYIARKGFNNIYMATYAPGPDSPSPGEMRFITYTNHSVLTNAPAPSNNTGNSGAIESSDVFGFANGTTSSKYYGEYRAIDAPTYGLTGGGFGVFMNIGNRETSSGGPFFKDIDFQTTSAQSTELYTYVFSGHSQTEDFRAGLHGPYALQLTTGGAPASIDYSFIEGLGLTGYVVAAARGTLAGTASGVPAGHQVTVALSNGSAQSWTTPDAVTGAYTMSGVLPGTYVETLYQDELAVGTQSVTISAGATTTANIADTLFSPPAVFLIGSWDGTPIGFLNADKITTMHPSDSRMSPWGTFTDATNTTAMTNYTVGSSTASDWPMAEWKQATTDPTKPIDNINRITFTLTAAQVVASTLRIGLTRASSGRPIISVNGGSFSSAPVSSSQPTARGVTLGNWRGNNVTYTYSISAGSLHVGTNTIDIEVASGSSSGSPWLGPWFIYDAIDLIATTNMASAPKVTTITVSPANPGVPLNGQQAFIAIAKDQFGNPMPTFPMGYTWSTTLGTIDSGGLYTAGSTSGSGTVTASYFDAPTNTTKSGTTSITSNAAPSIATAAAASPNPVTTTTANLSVLGADDGGEANLTYTWAATSIPAGVAQPTYSVNGTNAAKNSVATFFKSGSYTFQATVRDAFGLSTTSSFSVIVNQTLGSVTVSPGSASLIIGQSQSFTAQGLDQFGNLLTSQPPFIWSLDDGSVGAIDAAGLYSAPASTAGSATVRATSGSKSGVATVTVAYLKGDLNFDGQRTAADLGALLAALCDLATYQADHPISDTDLIMIADTDGDGQVTNGDVQGLINLLTHGNPAPAAIRAASTTAGQEGAFAAGSGMMLVVDSIAGASAEPNLAMAATAQAAPTAESSIGSLSSGPLAFLTDPPQSVHVSFGKGSVISASDIGLLAGLNRSQAARDDILLPRATQSSAGADELVGRGSLSQRDGLFELLGRWPESGERLVEHPVATDFGQDLLDESSLVGSWETA